MRSSFALVNIRFTPRGVLTLFTLLLMLASCFFCFLLYLRLQEHKQNVTVTTTSGTVVQPAELEQCEADRVFSRWQRRRSRAVRELEDQCNARGYNRNFHGDDYKVFESLIVDEKRRVLFCDIPKIASLNWRRVFLSFAGVATLPEEITPGDVYTKHVTKLRTLANFSNYTAYRMLQSFTKVIFVRDPFERFVSAYVNKFVEYPDYFTSILGAEIRKYRSPDADPNEIKIHFDEFVRYATHLNATTANEHWARYVDLCQPCKVNYTVIGRLERLNIDAPCTLRLILKNWQNSTVFFPRHPKRTSSNTVAKQFANITDAEVVALWKRYEEDFHLFGYRFPELERSSLKRFRSALLKHGKL